MEKLNRKTMGLNKDLPEKILMFGEGNFLRAFAGFIIQKLNDSGFYSGNITALQGTEIGMCDTINSQNGLYTVVERGMEKGDAVEKYTLINCLKRCVNPYTDYNKYLESAKNPELSVLISNTTEFGICYLDKERKENEIHKNYPAKLTDFLYKRYIYFKGNPDKGLVILPCELIDRNGDKLKDIVLRYASEWNLGACFIDWLNNSNVFANTLVDRIVSGYPKEDASRICEKLGFQDDLLDTCEPFLLWVIEGDKKRILEKIPFDKSGLDIIITQNLELYRTRKVRILNGAHTMSVLAGHLCGFEFVEQLVNDEIFSKYIQQGIFEEIIPSMQGEKLREYAYDVIERFKNPYLKHRLLSISLNSVSKFKARVLPSIKDYIKKFRRAPKILSFSLAALIYFYKEGLGSFVNDEKQFKDIFKGLLENSADSESLIFSALSNNTLWEEDLTKQDGLCTAVTFHYKNIKDKGMVNAVKETING